MFYKRPTWSPMQRTVFIQTGLKWGVLRNCSRRSSLTTYVRSTRRITAVSQISSNPTWLWWTVIMIFLTIRLIGSRRKNWMNCFRMCHMPLHSAVTTSILMEMRWMRPDSFSVQMQVRANGAVQCRVWWGIAETGWLFRHGTGKGACQEVWGWAEIHGCHRFLYEFRTEGNYTRPWRNSPMLPTTMCAHTAITVTAHHIRWDRQHKERREQAFWLDCLTTSDGPRQQSNNFLATNVTKTLDHYMY